MKIMKVLATAQIILEKIKASAIFLFIFFFMGGGGVIRR